MSSSEQSVPSPKPVLLAGFEILEKIGEGGMGTVFRARQVSLDRVVALKLLVPQLAADEQYVASFIQEAKAAGRLSHPNIIPVHDAGEAGGRYYYAMELVEGETLFQWAQRKGALSEETVLGLSICVANALQYAWDKEQLIHRDIKPDNIIIDRAGNVKVCDLGLAKNFGISSNLTQSGRTYGTPQYMSPEQARGESSLDARADIYSLGATMYFALTGQVPFQADAPAMVLAKQLTEQLPDIRHVSPDVSENTCRVVEKMLAMEAGERYQNWDEALHDLQLVYQGESPELAAVFEGKSAVRRGDVGEWGNGRMGETAESSSSSKSAVSRSRLDKLEARPTLWRKRVVVGAVAVILLTIGAGAGVFLFRGQQQAAVKGEGLGMTQAGTPDSQAGTPVLPIDQPKAGQTLNPQAEPSPRDAAPKAGQTLNPQAGTPAPPEPLQTFDEFSKQYLALLAKRDYAGAMKLAAAAHQTPALASSKELLNGAGEIAERLDNFWQSFPDEIRKLRGKPVTLGDGRRVHINDVSNRVIIFKGQVILDFPQFFRKMGKARFVGLRWQSVFGGQRGHHCPSFERKTRSPSAKAW